MANALGALTLFCGGLMGGFVLVKDDIHPWTCVTLLPVAASALGTGSVCNTTYICWPALVSYYCVLNARQSLATCRRAVASRCMCLSQGRHSLSNNMPGPGDILRSAATPVSHRAQHPRLSS